MAATLEAALRIWHLEAARFRGGKLRGDPGVFTRALDDPTPAGISCHIEHGREGERNSILRGFRGGAACRSLPGVRIEQAGLRQRHREDRAMTVDDVEAQQQWNPESGILDCDPLQGAHLVGAPEVQHVADASGANALIERAALARAGDDAGVPRPVLSCPIFSSSVIAASSVSIRPMLWPCCKLMRLTLGNCSRPDRSTRRGGNGSIR